MGAIRAKKRGKVNCAHHCPGIQMSPGQGQSDEKLTGDLVEDGFQGTMVIEARLE
jgi:hypothetical protein